MSDDELWIVVPNWDRFQHYKDRSPAWIKQHNELVLRDDYLDLSPIERALLHGIWSLYALTDGRVRRNEIASRLRLRARSAHWEALNHAGFIRFSASRPLALARSREERRVEKNARAKEKPRKPDDAHRANAAAYRPFPTLEQDDFERELPDIARRWLNG